MAWSVGNAEHYHVGHDTDELYPALLSDDGYAILYFGERNGFAVFRYRSSDFSFPFQATRYGTNGEALDGWIVRIGDSERLISNARGAEYYAAHYEEFTSNISKALTQHMDWPPEYTKSRPSVRPIIFE